MVKRLHHAIGGAFARIADFLGHSVVQLAVLLGCGLWLALGGSEGRLSSMLTIGGFILTQMVLNQQRRRENALHLKIDELLLAVEGARNEVIGTETLGEERIEELRRNHEF